MTKDKNTEEEIFTADAQQDNVETNAETTTETQPAEEKTTEERLADALAEIEELKTRALYRQAEFDNYRKRVIQEKADLILNGGTKVLEAILPVVDDMERALQNMDKAEDVAAIKEGVDLILQKFLSTLKGQGVVPMETADADFNTDFHEAIAQIPAPEDALKGKVIDCTKKGYLYNEKVLRFAQVVVGV